MAAIAQLSGFSDTLGTEVLGQLKSGWIAEALACCRVKCIGFDQQPEALRSKLFLELLLTTDARESFVGRLPDLAGRTELVGTFLVQVEEVMDTSKPIKERYTAAPSSSRLLKLDLFDGVRKVVAMEHEPIMELNVSLARGAKLVLVGPLRISRGALLLRPGNVRVLGGYVKELEAQRMAIIQEITKDPIGRRGPPLNLETFLSMVCGAATAALFAPRGSGALEPAPGAAGQAARAPQARQQAPQAQPPPPRSPEPEPRPGSGPAVHHPPPQQYHNPHPPKNPQPAPQQQQQHYQPPPHRAAAVPPPPERESISFGSGHVPDVQCFPTVNNQQQRGPQMQQQQQQWAPPPPPQMQQMQQPEPSAHCGVGGVQAPLNGQHQPQQQPPQQPAIFQTGGGGDGGDSFYIDGEDGEGWPSSSDEEAKQQGGGNAAPAAPAAAADRAEEEAMETDDDLEEPAVRLRLLEEPHEGGGDEVVAIDVDEEGQEPEIIPETAEVEGNSGGVRAQPMGAAREAEGDGVVNLTSQTEPREGEQQGAGQRNYNPGASSRSPLDRSRSRAGRTAADDLIDDSDDDEGGRGRPQPAISYRSSSGKKKARRQSVGQRRSRSPSPSILNNPGGGGAAAADAAHLKKRCSSGGGGGFPELQMEPKPQQAVELAAAPWSNVSGGVPLARANLGAKFSSARATGGEERGAGSGVPFCSGKSPGLGLGVRLMDASLLLDAPPPSLQQMRAGFSPEAPPQQQQRRSGGGGDTTAPQTVAAAGRNVPNNHNEPHGGGSFAFPAITAAAGSEAVRPSSLAFHRSAGQHHGSAGSAPFIYVHSLVGHINAAAPEDFPVHAAINGTVLKAAKSVKTDRGISFQVKVCDGSGSLIVELAQELVLDMVNSYLSQARTMLISSPEDLRKRLYEESTTGITPVRNSLQRVNKDIMQHYGVMELRVDGPGQRPTLVQLLGGGLSESQRDALKARGLENRES